jgi:DNA-binding response OmpR family regulator
MLHDEIETHELANPDEAYEKGTGWLKPDLVLLGVSFLAQQGPGIVATLKEKFDGVRILIICEKKDETIAVEGIKAGAHGALVKPLSLEAVRKKVDTVLGRNGGDTLIQLGGLN